MMKHWQILTNLENEIIRTSEFGNLYKLVLGGVESGATLSELQTGLYTMQGMLEDINEKLYPAFQALWDVIREESFSEKEELMNEVETPNYDHKPLEDVMAAWAKSKK